MRGVGRTRSVEKVTEEKVSMKLKVKEDLAAKDCSLRNRRS